MTKMARKIEELACKALFNIDSKNNHRFSEYYKSNLCHHFLRRSLSSTELFADVELITNYTKGNS